MLSAHESVEIGSSNRWVALYKGLKVTVYTVDKPEINLTRQDLIELINVRILSFITCKLFFDCKFVLQHFDYTNDRLSAFGYYLRRVA